jgi:hypothetical protein
MWLDSSSLSLGVLGAGEPALSIDAHDVYEIA